MEKDFARKLVKDALQHSFEKERFTYLVKNLLNKIEETPETVYRGNYIPDAYKDYISTLERTSKYIDPEGKKLDILVVYLKKTTSLERARTMQRNFVAWYLNGSRGGILKDAALAAFVAPDEDDWRFSFIKMEYKLAESLKGNLKAKEELTPARRYSFLVGKNENSHTAQSRLVPVLMEDEHNPTLKEIEDVFGIEKVTKEFFEKYRDLFLKLKESLDEIVQKSKKIKDDFDAKNVDTVDFAKKLLGQIVFLYFLQKKGWFGVKRGKPWGSGSKHFLRELFEKRHSDYKNFFNDILEPLFYEALRLERQDDYYSRFDCRIPFLNGGLFDPINDYDWIDTDVLLSDELFSNELQTKEGDTGTGILDVFDRYNFTVKEDEPLEKEVAIDPEMLGKVFENLLEVKDRKSKGTYYTPREIVHYMCQQSLINYLDTAINTTKKPVVPEKPVQEKFFGSKEAQQKSLATEQYNCVIPKEEIELFIKYGDTRIEHEIIAMQKIENIKNGKQKSSSYKLSLSESIHSNSKLLDDALKTIRVCDPAVGSGAFLVGMMHEIVNARTVLSTYLNGSKSRTPYEFKRDAIQSCLYGVDIDPGAVEIAKLRLWLSLVVEEDDIRTIKPLPNLDYKIVHGNSLLCVEHTLENWKEFAELERLKPLFFNETNTRKKQAYKNQIDQTITKLTNDHADFDFEVYFSEVFHEKGGFDIAIANPPYVQIKQIPWDERKIFKKKFASAVGRFNLFYFFLELSSKVARPNGFSTYIVPDRLLLNTQCDQLRKWLLKEQTILEIDSFREGVFEAVVDSIIILYRSDKSAAKEVKVKNRVTLDGLMQNDSINVPTSYFLNSPSNQFDLSYNPLVARLLEKIKSQSVPLGEISDIKDGIIQGKIADRLFLDKPLDDDSEPLLFGEDVTKYSIRFNNNWVNYKPSEMMQIEVKRRDEGVRHGLWMRTPGIFERNKILTRQTADEIVAAYDTENYYYSNTLHGTTILNTQYHPLYVLAILNSKLITWYYRSTTAEEGKVFAQVKIELLRLLPIPKTSVHEQQSFIDTVDKILTITKNKDYLENSAKRANVKELEKQIDQMVYKLYDLTDKEIAIVEGTIK